MAPSHVPNIDPEVEILEGADTAHAQLSAAEIVTKFREKCSELAGSSSAPTLTVVRSGPKATSRPLTVHVTSASQLVDMVDVDGGHEELSLAGLNMAAQPREIFPLPAREKKWAKCVGTVVADLRARFELLGFTESRDEFTPWQIMSMFHTGGSGRELVDMVAKHANFPPGATNAQVINTIHQWFATEGGYKVTARDCVATINAETIKGWSAMDRGGSPPLVQYVFPKREPVKLSNMLLGATRIIVSSFVAYTRMLRRSHWVGTKSSKYCDHLKDGEQRRLSWDQLLALDISKDPTCPFVYLNLGRPYDKIQANAHRLYSTGRAVSADVTGWDRSLPRTIITALFEGIYGTEVASKWTRQLCGGGVYQVGQSIVKFANPDVVLWPSGNANTLLGNSIIHAGLLISCGYPRDKFTVQGDDVVCCPVDGKSETVTAHYRDAGFSLKKVDNGPDQDFCGVSIADPNPTLINPIKILSKMLARIDGAASSRRRGQIASLLAASEPCPQREALRTVAISQFGLTEEELERARPAKASADHASVTDEPERKFTLNGHLQVCGLEGRYKEDFSSENNAKADLDEADFDDVEVDEENPKTHKQVRAAKWAEQQEVQRLAAEYSEGLLRRGGNHNDFESSNFEDLRKVANAVVRAQEEARQYEY